MNRKFNLFPVLSFLLVNVFFCTVEIAGIPLLPGLTISWIFHWTLYRPETHTALIFVATGFVYDLILGNPLGFSPLLFLLCYLGVYHTRIYLYRLPFLHIWLAFTVYSLLFGLLYWCLASLMLRSWLIPYDAFFSLCFTAALYPFVSRVMIFLQRKVYG